jgi:rare lipoprotein A
MIRRELLLCAILLSAYGCKKSTAPVSVSNEKGVASWYGVPFDGRPTASGEIFDKEKLTAAHRTLPFGTMVRVLNLHNQKTIDVKINDRGPFVADRIIDLAEAAARNIDVSGTTDAELEILSVPPQRAADNFAVQVAMIEDHAEATRLRESLESQYGTASLALREGSPPMWRVMVGMEPTEAAAAQLASRIPNPRGANFVVRIDAQ